jgi:hypothetical protein
MLARAACTKQIIGLAFDGLGNKALMAFPMGSHMHSATVTCPAVMSDLQFQVVLSSLMLNTV